MDAFKKPERHQVDDEVIPEGIDKRITQIKHIRQNRLQRVEREKKQAQEALQETYKNLEIERKKIANQMMTFTILETVLESHYLGDGIYMNHLRRWMDETQEIKPRIDALKQVHNSHMQDCFDAKKYLHDKTQEVKTLLLQTEKLILLEETWDDF